MRKRLKTLVVNASSYVGERGPSVLIPCSGVGVSMFRVMALIGSNSNKAIEVHAAVSEVKYRYSLGMGRFAYPPDKSCRRRA